MLRNDRLESEAKLGEEQQRAEAREADHATMMEKLSQQLRAAGQVPAPSPSRSRSPCAPRALHPPALSHHALQAVDSHVPCTSATQQVAREAAPPRAPPRASSQGAAQGQPPSHASVGGALLRAASGGGAGGSGAGGEGGAGGTRRGVLGLAVRGWKRGADGAWFKHQGEDKGEGADPVGGGRSSNFSASGANTDAEGGGGGKRARTEQQGGVGGGGEKEG
ncbi:hypothetical protein T484DRAFT_1886744 [Baffinella frigidus]|nr:hypothetical protein T484DRAFT_1886744 [Cryptophyta sp. CCMP2293]